ncbi:hypothetical protein SAMD00023353_2800120 [Rosellinia necatrix]|uniref:Uncharacterized protein n=1 Tax=Rosellinia necatrix TaxID=77044 RepID=A0A1W2THT7_ROSNE|nr:hypothetical protein SAMD00023353_2800120 [Rosellinia necatrix]
MLLSPSPIHRQGRLAPGLNLTRLSRGHRQGRKTDHLRASLSTRKRSRHTSRVGWDRDENEDGRRLASDPTVALPGEGRRPTPRLERQEAFCAPETWDILDTDVVLDDIVLYRLGILYDDDHCEHGKSEPDKNEYVHQSGFCLDSIRHEEPAYSLRQAKRVKRSHTRQFLSEREDLHHPAGLLSSYLADDTAIARFLVPKSGHVSTPLCTSGFNDTNRQLRKHDTPAAMISSEPLSIIYELSEGLVHALPPSPTTNDFPDLVSDMEGECEGDDEDNPSGREWALVADSDSEASLFGDGAWGDVDVDVITDGHVEIADAADGAWIFLAGDDS